MYSSHVLQGVASDQQRSTNYLQSSHCNLQAISRGPGLGDIFINVPAIFTVYLLTSKNLEIIWRVSIFSAVITLPSESLGTSTHSVQFRFRNLGCAWAQFWIWCFLVDIWSLAWCLPRIINIKCCSGKVIFSTHSNTRLLCSVERAMPNSAMNV